MSSSTRDHLPSKGGRNGQRGQDHDECQVVATGPCDSSGGRQAADAGVCRNAAGVDPTTGAAARSTGGAGGRPGAGASRAREVVEPADSQEEEGEGVAAV